MWYQTCPNEISRKGDCFVKKTNIFYFFSFFAMKHLEKGRKSLLKNEYLFQDSQPKKKKLKPVEKTKYKLKDYFEHNDDQDQD